MPRANIDCIRIAGVAGAVPEARVNNLVDQTFCSEEDRKKIVSLTGVPEYRKAPPDLCASDLCLAAANRLLGALNVQASEIDAILFVSMTPDFRVPSTACILQDRLGCSKTVLAYDINMGCSGYLVGLFNAAALIGGAGLDRVLLLAGDTQTKLCHEEDKNVAFILGDAGSATLVERGRTGETLTIESMTDGSRYANLYVPAGGCRVPSDSSTRRVEAQKDGGKRSKEHLYMNGMEIFKFSSTDVVKSLERFLDETQSEVGDYDFFFMHQANKFMNDKMARRLKFPEEKVPYSIGLYGNTGSASIPLTIAHRFSGNSHDSRRRSLLCGFGVGLSWGIADIDLTTTVTPTVAECS